MINDITCTYFQRSYKCSQKAFYQKISLTNLWLSVKSSVQKQKEMKKSGARPFDFLFYLGTPIIAYVTLIMKMS